MAQLAKGDAGANGDLHDLFIKTRAATHGAGAPWPCGPAASRAFAACAMLKMDMRDANIHRNRTHGDQRDGR